jgi:hypothetical protein
MDAEYQAILLRELSRRKQIAQSAKKLKKLRTSEVQALFHALHERAFSRIDCLKCANCCAEVGPLVNDQDIRRFAKALSMSKSSFVSEYLREDEDGDLVFASRRCPFLCDDNRCLVYENRPKACREFPHTDQRYIHRYISQTRINAGHCPAVALMFEFIIDGQLV